MIYRKYGTLLVTGTTAIRVPIIKRGVVDYAVGADWTPAAGDVKVDVDGTISNITNLPTAVATGNGARWEFILTAAELTGKQIGIVIADSATKAVEDQSVMIETYGHASAMFQSDLSAANFPANVTQFAGSAITSASGIPEVKVASIANDAITASAIADAAIDTATFAAGTTIPQVTLVDTCTTNTDMRGTDNALLAASYTAPPSASTISTQVAADLEAAHGAGSWQTATGFSTHSAADVWAVGTRTITGGSLTTSPPTAAAIADAVWDEARADHVTPGSFGENVTAELDSATQTQIDNIETFATRITTGIVQDGAFWQFTANMLELGPAGGGGSGTVNVLPATGIVADRSAGSTLNPVVGETISQSITVYQSDGTTAYDLSGKTLAIIFETMSGVDVAVVEAADITIGGASDNVVTFAYPSAVTASERTLRFAIRDAAAPLTMYLQGVCSVVAAPKVDA